jgi:hypothetical protein
MAVNKLQSDRAVTSLHPRAWQPCWVSCKLFSGLCSCKEMGVLYKNRKNLSWKFNRFLKKIVHRFLMSMMLWISVVLWDGQLSMYST